MSLISRRVLAAVFLIALTGSALTDNWKPVEIVENYRVSGRSGIELYRAIEKNGPRIGVGRVIAYTDFKLLWSRDYKRQPDGSCILASARPNLTITYHLPEATGDMPRHVRGLWDRFVEGVRAHEKMHGDFIVDMVKAIEKNSIGLSIPNDPGCRKIRAELQNRFASLSQEQRRRSREFDALEMQKGGNVHRLVLGLVNG